MDFVQCRHGRVIECRLGPGQFQRKRQYNSNVITWTAVKDVIRLQSTVVREFGAMRSVYG